MLSKHPLVNEENVTVIWDYYEFSGRKKMTLDVLCYHIREYVVMHQLENHLLAHISLWIKCAIAIKRDEFDKCSTLLGAPIRVIVNIDLYVS